MNLVILGEKLKKLRQAHNMQSADVAKKLNVTAPYYSGLETGKEKPSKRILETLSGLYELPANEMMSLFDLAGYAINNKPITSNLGKIENMNQPMTGTIATNVQINALEQKILFSDAMFISISENGVVFDFGQKVGPTDQQVIVSRVGVSYGHAKKIHSLLGQQLSKAEDMGIER